MAHVVGFVVRGSTCKLYFSLTSSYIGTGFAAWRCERSTWKQ